MILPLICGPLEICPLGWDSGNRRDTQTIKVALIFKLRFGFSYHSEKMEANDRDSIQVLSRLLLSAQLRNLKTQREKVLALKMLSSGSMADIVQVTQCSRTSAYRWCTDPGSEPCIGRKPYLHVDDFEELFQHLIPEAAHDHNAMDFPTISEKVR